MPLGAGSGSCGKRLEKCDISLIKDEILKSHLIERAAHLLALQQLYRFLVDIFLYFGADAGRLGTESW